MRKLEIVPDSYCRKWVQELTKDPHRNFRELLQTWMRLDTVNDLP